MSSVSGQTLQVVDNAASTRVDASIHSITASATARVQLSGPNTPVNGACADVDCSFDSTQDPTGTVDMGAGDDVFMQSRRTAGATIESDIFTLTVNGGDGHDSISTLQDGAVNGGPGDDVITMLTESASTSITCGTGNDTVYFTAPQQTADASCEKQYPAVYGYTILQTDLDPAGEDPAVGPSSAASMTVSNLDWSDGDLFGPDGIAPDSLPLIGADPDSIRWQCRLDEGAWQTCEIGTRFENLTAGVHWLDARPLWNGGEIVWEANENVAGPYTLTAPTTTVPPLITDPPPNPHTATHPETPRNPRLRLGFSRIRAGISRSRGDGFGVIAVRFRSQYDCPGRGPWWPVLRR